MPYFTTSDNCRLYYETHGADDSRKALVFLNGTTQTTVHWRPQVLHFRDEFRVLVYDGRAQGRSESGSAPLSLDRHCRDLRGLLDHLEIERAHLVGLSHGAHVALALAARHPHKVDAIVLCGLGDETTARTRTMVRSWLEVVRGGGQKALAWAILPVTLGENFLAQKRTMLSKMAAATAARNRPEALAAHFEALLNYPPPRQLASALQATVLVLSGKQDLLVPPSSARRLANLCRGRYLAIDDCGHTVPAEAGDRFNREVHRFLTSFSHRRPSPS